MLAPTTARAQDLPLTLTWDAPPSCPDAPAIRRELERVVVVEEGLAPDALTASGTITSTTRGFRLVLETERSGERGRRTLLATRCEDLLAAATLVLALAYGVGVELRTDDEPHEDARESPPVAASPPPETAPETPPAPAREPIESPAPTTTGEHDALMGALSIEVGATWGLVPEPAFLGVLGGELGNDYVRGRLRLGVAPGASIPLGAGMSAEFIDLFAGVEGCGAAPIELASSVALRGEACLGLVLHALHARSVGLAEDREALAPVLNLRGALGAGVVLGSLELRLVGALEWAPRPPRFEVIGLGVVYTAGELTLSGTLVVAFAP